MRESPLTLNPQSLVTHFFCDLFCDAIGDLSFQPDLFCRDGLHDEHVHAIGLVRMRSVMEEAGLLRVVDDVDDLGEMQGGLFGDR